ncbi:MAG TPA: hypothetical protein VF335_09355 [Chitinivibrionales bacterium]
MVTKMRWYDKHETLALLLERFKAMAGERKTALIGGVMEIIKKDDPQLLDNHVMDFPLDRNKRRWYDNDPYLWLLFNGLRYAEIHLLKKVEHYLSGRLRQTPQ